MRSEQKIILHYNFQRKVDGESIFRMLHHMRGCGFDSEQSILHHGFDGDTLPNRIELAPTRHTVNIHLNLGARQPIELIPGPAFLLLHFAPYTEIPGRRVEVRNRSIMQDREFKCQRLPGREPAFLADTLFLLASIDSFERKHSDLLSQKLYQ